MHGLLVKLDKSFLRDTAADAIASHAVAHAITHDSIKYPAQFYDFVYNMIRPITRSLTTLKQDSSQSISSVRFRNAVKLLCDGSMSSRTPWRRRLLSMPILYEAICGLFIIPDTRILASTSPVRLRWAQKDGCSQI